MKSKAPFVLVLIGVILGLLLSLMRIVSYFVLKRIDWSVSDSLQMFEGLMLWHLILSITGIILSLVLIFYVVRIGKKLTRKDSIVVTVLGGLGIFLGLGIGGVLVLIGGIIGIVKSDKS
ncbi:MAG: hypothetical protein KJ600_06425 [Nanoarchaeota archaeon]|nr:hypothetical protein [Nanoarchaeota archaeon]MBU1104160.1 hypothetical protein [Nanoarchaeota archaeon]